MIAADRPNTIGLSDRDLASLLDKMEAADRAAGVDTRRAFARWPFRRVAVSVTLIHPGGSSVSLRLACRNLSRGGCSLFHSAFVHPGTGCIVVLPAADGTDRELKGSIKRCIHRVATLHELGMSFEKEIDLRDFLPAEAGRICHSLEHVEPGKLAGRVLLAEGSEIDARIITHFLRETALEVTRASTIKDAVEQGSKFFDTILVDWRVGKESGVDAIAKLREAGVGAPVILMTPDPGAATESGVLSHPDVALLKKPISEEQLLRALAEQLLMRGGGSVAAGSGEQHPLAEQFGDELKGYIATLESALKAFDAAALEETALQIQGTAPTVGFPELGAHAQTLRGALKNGTGTEAGKSAVHRAAGALVMHTRRALAGIKRAPSK